MRWPEFILGPQPGLVHSCNCIGPQNGNPVCPCLMPDHNRRKMGEMALDLIMRTKPRIRVKAGRRAANA